MKRTFVFLGLCLLLTLNYGFVNAEKQSGNKPVRAYNAYLYYSNSTPGNLYISLYSVATSSNVASFNVPPGSGFLISVPEGTYHSYMGGNGGTYTFNINGATATGTGHSFHNVYLSAGSNSFSAY